MPTLLRPSQISGIPLTKIVPTLLLTSITETAVGTTLTETTYFSFTLPGGTLGTNGQIVIKTFGTWLQNATAGYLTNLKYGGVAITAMPSFTQVNNAAALGLVQTYLLKNNGATNAQKGTAHWEPNSSGDGAYGTGAIDSTLDQLVEVTAKWSVSSASAVYTMWHAYVWFIPAVT